MSAFDPQVLIKQLGTALPMMGAQSLVAGSDVDNLHTTLKSLTGLEIRL